MDLISHKQGKDGFSTLQGSVYLTQFNRKVLLGFDKSSEKVNTRTIINKINYINFTKGSVRAHIQDDYDEKEYLLTVFPEPCKGGEFTGKLREEASLDFNRFKLKNILIDDGKTVTCVPVEIASRTKDSFTVRINKGGYTLGERHARRYQCRMIDAEILQGDFIIQGVLEDFSPSGFRIALNGTSVISLGILDKDRNLNLNLYKDKSSIFSGICKFIRDEDEGGIIIRPITQTLTRYKERKHRSPRLNLIPSPKILFNHPVINKRVTYEIVDITSTGFSVSESIEESLLLPGMVVSDLTILYSGGLELKCSAQIVYCKNKPKRTKQYGFAITDMNVVEYNKLFDTLSNAIDPYANLSCSVDLDELWRFLFESGFIYPKKYETLSNFIDAFKETYERLYHKCPSIFSNLTYQRNGGIYGHVSMIKAYQRTWMVHHLAAKSMGWKPIGLKILNQILYYYDGLYRLPSIGMDYMIFYYRPENKFPDFFFGGIYNKFNNLKKCSIDLFAYLNFTLDSRNNSLPKGWGIFECSNEDLRDFREWYDQKSGGLLFDAFFLDKKVEGEEPIENTYERLGLHRSCSSFVLKHDGSNKVYIIVDKSDRGINLSDLLNTMKIFVKDAENLRWEILNQLILNIGAMYDSKEIPILVYPKSYVDDMDVKYDKKYCLWILDTQYGDDYPDLLKHKVKFRVGKLLIKMLLSYVSKIIKKKMK